MNCLLLPAENFSASCASISCPSQLAHIIKILDLKVGDSLKIGQLGGYLGTAIIDSITADIIQLREVRLTLPPPTKLDITVVLALPRPKVLRRLLIDMTALGVRDIILINSYRSQKSYWQSPMLNRLDEFVLEGLQQGVDSVAPTIRLEKRFKPFVQDKLASLIRGNNVNDNSSKNGSKNSSNSNSDLNQAIVAHPYSELSFSQYLQSNKSSTDKINLPKVVFIGSEGGWIDYEIELLISQGCHSVNIGSRILRTEAAVNAIVGQWLLHT